MGWGSAEDVKRTSSEARDEAVEGVDPSDSVSRDKVRPPRDLEVASTPTPTPTPRGAARSIAGGAQRERRKTAEHSSQHKGNLGKGARGM